MLRRSVITIKYQKIPSGTFLGIFLVLALYWMFRSKSSR